MLESKTTPELAEELAALEDEYGRKFVVESRKKELNEIWEKIKAIKAELEKRKQKNT